MLTATDLNNNTSGLIAQTEILSGKKSFICLVSRGPSSVRIDMQATRPCCSRTAMKGPGCDALVQEALALQRTSLTQCSVFSDAQGEHLRICPQGYTCCTSAMEETLSNLSRREFEGLVREAGRSIQASLNAQYRTFDTYFLELLNGSERWLEEAFVAALGDLYRPNAGVFRELYGELRRYYSGASLNLEEVLDEFWMRLLERLLKASDPETASLLSDDFLECASKQTETLRPFGDAPRELKTKLVRAFIAARAFIQGLNVAGEIVRKVSQVGAVNVHHSLPPSIRLSKAQNPQLLPGRHSKNDFPRVPLSLECNRAIMKLVYCPHCRGLGSVKPCVNYCKNVMKGCLANQADLDTEWQSLIETMLQVASSFGAEPSMDTVIYSIPVRISEAVLAMQENMEIYTSKVFKACGDRGEEGTPSSISEEPKKKASTVTALEYKPSPKSAARLEVQVTDVSSKLKEMQFYWIQLPSALCSGKTASSTTSDKCWNGMTKASYLPEVMGDGLANQINNPEVEIDITKPDRTIRQQIMLLKIMSNRLKNALNGNDVDFQDTSDDFSGSGSGMCADHLCVRGRPPVFGPKTDRPKLYAYSPENKRVKGSGNQIQPSVILLVLLPATLLLRR
ncbi:Glypican-1 [Labeo rohita]|uniref:Glypican-1 n=1 Tax=Labeo rohita TaxID=84645 RepID=A0ABQ8LIG0_LABRO|nr:Glypican-1 [Labeo rohita]